MEGSWTTHIVRVYWFLLVALFIQGCALSPKSETARNDSAALLNKRLQEVEVYLQNHPKDKRALIFVGSAQHSQSKAFQGDVLGLKIKLEEINPSVQSIVLSNELQSSTLQYPFATGPNLSLVLRKVNQWSKQTPITLVLLISTHGNVNSLSVNIANEYLPPMSPRYLRELLDPLGNTPTLLVLSACFSGSFLPATAAENRVVLTAAAADRSSFGCSFQSKNTFFIDQLLKKGLEPEGTWRQGFEKTVTGVIELEKAAKASPFSNPQVSVPRAYESASIRRFLTQ